MRCVGGGDVESATITAMNWQDNVYRRAGHRPAVRVWVTRARWAASQPSWVTKLAVVAGAVVLPLVLFAVAAVLLAAAVFVVLAVVVSWMRQLGRWWGAEAVDAKKGVPPVRVNCRPLRR